MEFKIGILLIAFTLTKSDFLESSKSSSNDLPKVRQKRNILQFGKMIEYETRRPALSYNRYGNHCGWVSGDAPVVDGVDKCCFIHDKCYDKAYYGVCSRYKLWSSMITYAWFIYDKKIVCRSSRKCPQAVCECDRAAAKCFAKAKYNRKHKKPSITDLFLG